MNPESESIRLFVKPGCPWCRDAIAWLDQRSIPYQKFDVKAEAAAWDEMVRLSGQTLAPVIEVNGRVLADFDTGQLARFWSELKLPGGAAHS